MAKLNVQDKMPNLVFNTAYQNNVNLHDVLKGKTVFWVLRYIGCTVCRYDVHLIQQSYEAFQKKGAQVFVVMQSDQAHVQNDLKDIQLPFDIICDDQMKIYEALSIEAAASLQELGGGEANLARLKEKGAKAKECGFVHGDYEGNEQQLPAMFIVEEDATISYAHYAKNIVDMPTIPEVLEML